MEERTLQEYEAIVSRPGKFESCPRFAPYYYDMMLEGWCDDSCGTDAIVYDMFRVKPPDTEKFSELKEGDCVYLSEDDNGFVNVATCTITEWEYFREEFETVE